MSEGSSSTPPWAVPAVVGVLVLGALGFFLVGRGGGGDGTDDLPPATPLGAAPIGQDPGRFGGGGGEVDDAELARQEGIRHAQAQRFREALDAFERMIELDPEDPEGYFNRAVVKKNLGDVEGAIADASQAIRIDDRHARAFAYRGSAYLALEQYEPAIADFTQAIALDPEDSISYGNRCLARMNSGDLKGAIEDGETAIEKGNPSAGSIRAALDELYLRIKAGGGS